MLTAIRGIGPGSGRSVASTGAVSNYKDGQALILGTDTGLPASSSQPPPGQKQNGGDQDSGTGPVLSMLLVLRSTLGEITGEYPAAVRASAGKLIESSIRFLAESYGDGESDDLTIVDLHGNVLVADGKFV
jgi:hypothetical protein